MADKELLSIQQELKRNLTSKDYRSATELLTTAKVALLQRNALIPTSATPSALLPIAREILELGALISIHLHDEPGFSRFYHQLQPFYNDRSITPPSQNKSKVTGLYLLLLLSKNDIAEFHTTLETLVGAEEDVFIKYPVMLERWLMEGSYDKVWNATKSTQVPSEEYSLFTKILVNTIRNEIAMCSEKAYSSIPIVNGINLFFLDSERAVVEFARDKGWDIQDGRIYFPQDDENREVLQAGNIIENTVAYARELETIV
ncbi:SAC3/GANP/Nin1/mts3/eIF-3 p25 family-domain-containing protein [Kalaharituber pfeilii]|nr:SAC3/GANP/Nin1/mts3/eIF-3 p25 family-domain-containing protein [Kalaharituber pfeilii]